MSYDFAMDAKPSRPSGGSMKRRVVSSDMTVKELLGYGEDHDIDGCHTALKKGQKDGLVTFINAKCKIETAAVGDEMSVNDLLQFGRDNNISGCSSAVKSSKKKGLIPHINEAIESDAGDTTVRELFANDKEHDTALTKGSKIEAAAVGDEMSVNDLLQFGRDNNISGCSSAVKSSKKKGLIVHINEAIGSDVDSMTVKELMKYGRVHDIDGCHAVYKRSPKQALVHHIKSFMTAEDTETKSSLFKLRGVGHVVGDREAWAEFTASDVCDLPYERVWKGRDLQRYLKWPDLLSEQLGDDAGERTSTRGPAIYEFWLRKPGSKTAKAENELIYVGVATYDGDKVKNRILSERHRTHQQVSKKVKSGDDSLQSIIKTVQARASNHDGHGRRLMWRWLICTSPGKAVGSERDIQEAHKSAFGHLPRYNLKMS